MLPCQQVAAGRGVGSYSFLNAQGCANRSSWHGTQRVVPREFQPESPKLLQKAERPTIEARLRRAGRGRNTAKSVLADARPESKGVPLSLGVRLKRFLELGFVRDISFGRGGFMDMNRIGVVGAGTMGNGIAHVFARGGYSVVLCDVEQRFLQRGIATITQNLDREVAKNKITAEDKASALKKIELVTDRARLADCDFVVEAATEKIEIKT